MEIPIGPEERKRGALDEESLARAVEAVRREGYVILSAAVRPAHLEILRQRMDEASRAPAATPWQLDPRSLQSPPTCAPYVFRDVVVNRFVVAVTRSVLGPGVYCNLYSVNSNGPGSTFQAPHVDAGQLWPGLAEAHPATTLVVNIPLEDVAEGNGSIELWPGTHRETGATYLVDERSVATRQRVVPPVRANTRRGSVLIRDARLWHRGTPNRSNRIRHMLAMNHNIFWLERGPHLRFDEACRELLASEDLKWHVELTRESEATGSRSLPGEMTFAVG
jgi:hypothetical protein